MISDEAHVARIASALWSRSPIGSAAALIGAGFSLNAEAALASSAAMPTWSELVVGMAKDLHPGTGTEAAWRRDEALRSAGATSGALRIAQEYEAQFGREALNRLIANHVPDLKYRPGEAHRLLLELPWADVMTTNWDTLIERTAPLVEDRVYHVVHTQADIATARSPRIVKLHGTLPSHRPFIFTEEDFRTYPQQFPAFVNLARQATMENSLVLLGFSGDDPNFLYWSGWVRDNLGEHAPTIYLVGCLNLSASRRKMLEERRVQPIDLCHLPDYANWPDVSRHALAMRWFLKRLSQGKPYSRARWPSVPATPNLSDDIAPHRVDPYAPLNVPRFPGDGWTADSVSMLIPILRHNREVYPGWVVAPEKARSRIAQHCPRHARGVAEVITKLDPRQAEDLLFEVNWEFETALLPMAEEVAAPARALLDPLIDASVPTVSVSLQALAFALLRDTREFNDAAGFARLATWLESVVRQDPEGRDRLAYEKILAAVEEVDLETIDRLLAEWDPQSDPFWKIRKAALVAEFGTLEDADRISREALVAIRQRTDKEKDDIASWSRESYTLVLRSYLLAANWDAAEAGEVERASFADRQHQLAARGCDADSNVSWFDNEMAHEPPPLVKDRSVTRLFDIGQQLETRHIASETPLMRRKSAFQALRFHEEIGRPARIGNMLFANDAIRQAAIWLLDVDPARATNALLRSAKTDDQEMERTFSRRALANMQDDRAEMLAHRLLRNANAMLARISAGGTDHDADTRFQVTLEVLSRMCVRVPAIAADGIELAISTYCTPSRHGRRNKALQHLFERSYAALADEQRHRLAPRLFDLPLPDYHDANNPTFDPAEIVGGYEAGEDSDSVWRQVVATLIPTLSDRKMRAAGQFRLHRLSDFNVLSAAEREDYGAVLWDPAFLENGLPGETRLYSWAFTKEGRAPDIAMAAVKARLLATVNFASTDAMRTITALVGDDDSKLDLTPDEQTILVRNYLTWLRGHEAARPSGGKTLRTDDMGADIGLSLPIIIKMGLASAETAAETEAFFAAGLPYHGCTALPELLRLELVSPEDALKHILPALLGEDQTRALIATHAIGAWMALDAPALPEGAWNHIVDAVYARLPGTVHICLGFLYHAYREDADRVPLHLDGRIAAASLLILNESSPTGSRDNLLYDPGTVRRIGGRLVSAMRAAGRLDDDVYAKWRDAASAERISEIDLEADDVST